MSRAITGTWLVPGPIAGEVLRLDEPLSFWGGFDAATGTIIDRAHPQHGLVLTDRVVVMPGSKGSSGTPGVLGESIRSGTGPHAMVITKADINLVAGALAAAALYDRSCPVLLVSDDEFRSTTDGELVVASPDQETA